MLKAIASLLLVLFLTTAAAAEKQAWIIVFTKPKCERCDALVKMLVEPDVMKHVLANKIFPMVINASTLPPGNIHALNLLIYPTTLLAEFDSKTGKWIEYKRVIGSFDEDKAKLIKFATKEKG
jgi:hypothetical protein